MAELTGAAPSVPTRVVQRLDGIDVLRGLSILAVILLHIWIRLVILNKLHLGADWPPMLRSLVWSNGGNGVTIFFAVSGFLITFTSLRRFGALGRISLPTFYRIRFARIMPLLLLLLAILSVLHLARVEDFRINAKHFTLARALFSALTFHLNWLEASRNAWLPAAWTVLWSLSIEEMFYLFFPILSVAFLRRIRWGIWLWMAVAIALIAMGPFARTTWSHTDLQQENSYLAGMSDIACGCIAAWLTDVAIKRGRIPKPTTLTFLKILGSLPIIVFATWPRWHWARPVLHWIGRSGTDDTLLAAGTSLIAAATALRPQAGHVWCAPIRWLGRHSYEIYLSHEFAVIVGVALFAHWFKASPPRLAVFAISTAIVATSALLGWALARFFSEPLNRKLRGAPLATQ